MVQRSIGRRALLRNGFGLAGGLGLGAAGLGLTGCSTGQGELGDGAGEITVWTWPDNDKVFIDTTVPIFERQFPHIKVNVQGFGGNGYNPKLLGALVSGTGPDVCMIEITWISNFMAKPGFVDLSKPPFNAGGFASKYAGFSWAYVNDPSTGRVFQLPKNTGPGGMFYRRDVLEDAGLPTDPEELHDTFKTWDDFITNGKKVVKPGERYLVDQPASVVGAIRNQQGVSYFDKEGNLTFTSEETVAACEMIPRLISAGVLAPQMTDQERGNAISSGKIATFFSGNWFGGWLKGTYATETAGKWGCALAPETNGISAFNQGGDFIGILQSSRKQKAAWEFVKWVSQNSDSLSTMYKRDLYPAWMPATSQSWINKPDPFYGDQNVNEVFREVSQTMKTPVTNPLDGIANTAFGNAVANIYANKTSDAKGIKAALATAAAEVESKRG